MENYTQKTQKIQKVKKSVGMNTIVQDKIDRLIDLKLVIKPLEEEQRDIKDEIKEYDSVKNAVQKNELIKINGTKGYVQIGTVVKNYIDKEAMSPRDKEAMRDLENRYTKQRQEIRIEIISN